VQLRDHPGPHRVDQLRRNAQHRGQLGVVAAVLRQRRRARLAPGRGRARVVAVGRDVDGVHGVPAGGGARVAVGEHDVGRGEARVELAQQRLASGLAHAASRFASRAPYGHQGDGDPERSERRVGYV